MNHIFPPDVTSHFSCKPVKQPYIYRQWWYNDPRHNHEKEWKYGNNRLILPICVGARCSWVSEATQGSGREITESWCNTLRHTTTEKYTNEMQNKSFGRNHRPSQWPWLNDPNQTTPLCLNRLSSTQSCSYPRQLKLLSIMNNLLRLGSMKREIVLQGTLLVQIMACHWFSAKPQSEPLFRWFWIDCWFMKYPFMCVYWIQ